MKIALSKPLFDQQELLEIQQVLDSGWVMQGPKVAEFERQFADYLGCKWAVAVSSCSTALHLAMRVSGIGKGDEVIVPSLTWIATAAAVEECGAHPVFCDVDQATFNIEPKHVAGLITQRTKAIVAVNLFGLAADLNALATIAADNGLILIEDAACSLGATISGKHSGTFGRLACFSFHPRKSITTGEGGMIVGIDDDDENQLRSLRSHGLKIETSQSASKQPYDLGDFDQLGYNYRLTDLQAAIGLAQMRKLDSIIERRRGIAAAYDSGLRGLPLITLPSEPRGYKHTYQSYVLLIAANGLDGRYSDLPTEIRNHIMIELAEAGIATRPGTHAVHTLGYFREKYGLVNSALPNSLNAMQHSIALPLHPALGEEEVRYVIEAIKSAHDSALKKFADSLSRSSESFHSERSFDGQVHQLFSS